MNGLTYLSIFATWLELFWNHSCWSWLIACSFLSSGLKKYSGAAENMKEQKEQLYIFNFLKYQMILQEKQHLIPIINFQILIYKFDVCFRAATHYNFNTNPSGNKKHWHKIVPQLPSINRLTSKSKVCQLLEKKF